MVSHEVVNVDGGGEHAGVGVEVDEGGEEGLGENGREGEGKGGGGAKLREERGGAELLDGGEEGGGGRMRAVRMVVGEEVEAYEGVGFGGDGCSEVVGGEARREGGDGAVDLALRREMRGLPALGAASRGVEPCG